MIISRWRGAVQFHPGPAERGACSASAHRGRIGPSPHASSAGTRSRRGEATSKRSAALSAPGNAVALSGRPTTTACADTGLTPTTSRQCPTGSPLRVPRGSTSLLGGLREEIQKLCDGEEPSAQPVVTGGSEYYDPMAEVEQVDQGGTSPSPSKTRVAVRACAVEPSTEKQSCAHWIAPFSMLFVGPVGDIKRLGTRGIGERPVTLETRGGGVRIKEPSDEQWKSMHYVLADNAPPCKSGEYEARCWPFIESVK